MAYKDVVFSCLCYLSGKWEFIGGAYFGSHKYGIDSTELHATSNTEITLNIFSFQTDRKIIFASFQHSKKDISSFFIVLIFVL